MIAWNEYRLEWLIVGILVGASLSGCGKSSETPKPDAVAPSLLQDDGGDAANLNSPAKPAPLNYNQSFENAIISEVLEGHHIPPDVTLGGKKTGLLRADVEKRWLKTTLTDANGKPLAPILKLETSEGQIEITLHPEWAPNHVRNIMTLVQLGYYDGLRFERNIHQVADFDGEKSRLDLLVAGCPTGTGDDGYGHLGYFVRAEFQPDLKHLEGTVGFWHEEDPDSAGCRFYIALGPAPVLDGRFTIIGQVSSGLNVAKRMASQPVKSTDPSSPDNERPVMPVSIKKAVISPELLEK